MTQRPSFMEELERRDPEFFELLNAVMEKARAPGALDTKTKTLITLALDAAGGHPQGVINLARRARSLGASDEEIVECIRLAFLVAGIPGLVSGLAAFQDQG